VDAVDSGRGFPWRSLSMDPVVLGHGFPRVWLSAGAVFQGYGCPRERFSAGTGRGRGFRGYGCPRARFSANAVRQKLMQHFSANIRYHSFSLCRGNRKHTSCHRYHSHLFLFSLQSIPSRYAIFALYSPIPCCHPATIFLILYNNLQQGRKRENSLRF
jgi:hypothetical protein